MKTALISLGANVASPGRSLVEMLGFALESVVGREGITLRRRSRWFRTPAFPPGSGPDFVNAAAALETALGPERLLAALHGAEQELGRVRTGRLMRWAPRVCDLDLIAIGDYLELHPRPTEDEKRELYNVLFYNLFALGHLGDAERYGLEIILLEPDVLSHFTTMGENAANCVTPSV